MTIEFAHSDGFYELLGHITAIENETLPENFATDELADAVQSLAIATADQRSSAIMDAASVRLIELQETIELLRAELKAIEELSQ